MRHGYLGIHRCIDRAILGRAANGKRERTRKICVFRRSVAPRYIPSIRSQYRGIRKQKKLRWRQERALESFIYREVSVYPHIKCTYFYPRSQYYDRDGYTSSHPRPRPLPALSLRRNNKTQQHSSQEPNHIFLEVEDNNRIYVDACPRTYHSDSRKKETCQAYSHRQKSIYLIDTESFGYSVRILLVGACN